MKVSIEVEPADLESLFNTCIHRYEAEMGIFTTDGLATHMRAIEARRIAVETALTVALGVSTTMTQPFHREADKAQRAEFRSWRRKRLVRKLRGWWRHITRRRFDWTP